MKKKIKILFISLLSIVIISLICFLIWNLFFKPHRGVITNFENSAPLSQNLSKKEALEDFDYAFKKLKNRHPVWLEKTEEAKHFRNLLTLKYQENKAYLDSKENISVTDLFQKLSELYALLHDGHTRVEFFSDELKEIDDYTPLFAFGNPVAVNGIDIEQLYQLFKTRCSYEVDTSIKKYFFSSYIFREDILSLLEIDTTKPAIYTYKTKSGYEDFTHNFVTYEDAFYPSKDDIKTFLQSKNYSQEEIQTRTNTSMGDYLTPDKVESAKVVGNPQNWIWYTIDQKNNIGILTFRECTYNDEYIQTVKNFFADVKEANINNVAVDLRGNGGGNSWVANEFIKHLNVDSYNTWDCAVRYGPYLQYYDNDFFTNEKYDTNFVGDIYILTNSKTYSAAMDFSMLIQDNNLGKVIGEASSNKPECYGDCLYFQLPNSKLHIAISFKKWYRIDQTKKDLLIEPDIPCPPQEAVSVLYDLISKH